METNSLAKVSNSGQFSSFLIAKSGNYRPFSVENLPDEGEFEEFLIFKKKDNPPDNATKNEKEREF